MLKLRKLFGISAHEMKLAAKLREMTITKLQRRKRSIPFEISTKENQVDEPLKHYPVTEVSEIIQPP